MKFHRWLLEQRAEVRRLYDADPGGEWSGRPARAIANEASRRAAEVRLPGLMETWPPDADVLEVDRYLVRCLGVVESSDSHYLTVAQAAARFNLGERTIYRMVEHGMPATRAGKSIRIKPSDLESHLEDDTLFT